MAPTKPQQMSREELERTPDYQSLSPKMKSWASAYIQTFLDFGKFDAHWATQQAYQCGSDENSRTFGYQMEGNKKVKALVRLFLNSGKTELEIDLAEIQKAIDAAEVGSVAHQRLLALKMSLKRGSKPAEPEPEPEAVTPVVCQVGDLVTQNGQKYLVTSIDANGSPLTADEVQ
jgi:hypothetical protein